MSNDERLYLSLMMQQDDDDEDEDEDEDDELLNKSFLHRRRKRPRAMTESESEGANDQTIVVTESSNSDSSNSKSGNNRIVESHSLSNDLQQSKEKSRRTSTSASTPTRFCTVPTKESTLDMDASLLQRVLDASQNPIQQRRNGGFQGLQINDNEDDTDDDELEVLPAGPDNYLLLQHDYDDDFDDGNENVDDEKKDNTNSNRMPRPRLSFSGQKAKDPVNLFDDSPNHVKAKRSTNSPSLLYCDDEEDDSEDVLVLNGNDEISKCVASKPLSPRLDALAMKKSRLLANQQATESEDSSDASSHVVVDQIKLSNTSAITSSLLYSSDDDDSFALQCRQYEAERKRPPSHSADEPKKIKNTNTNKKYVKNPYAAKLEQKAQKQATKESRERGRIEAKVVKEREKQAARDQRERERQAKQAIKEATKKQRQDLRERTNQRRGRYANQEIVILAEPSILDTQTNPWKIQETLAASGFNHVQRYASGLSCHALQFIRQEYLQGGANQATETLMKQGLTGSSTHTSSTSFVSYEHIELLAIVVEANGFIELIQLDPEDEDGKTTSPSYSEDDDYPLLERWLFGLVAGWRAAWHKTPATRPRIILLLYKIPEILDREWVQYNRSGRRGPCPPNSEQLHDAILWMLIQFQVESIHCATPEDVSHEVYKMTRFLAESPYSKQATDLQATSKLPAHVSDMAPNFDRSRDTWIRQLQQIPRLSAEMAHNLARHYPTALSLYKVYQDKLLSTEEKQFLLADLFGTHASKVKLSMHVYRVLMGTNPEEILS